MAAISKRLILCMFSHKPKIIINCQLEAFCSKAITHIVLLRHIVVWMRSAYNPFTKCDVELKKEKNYYAHALVVAYHINTQWPAAYHIN